MLWCVMNLHFLDQPSRGWSVKCLIKGREDVRIQVIHHQDNFFCIPIMNINHFLHGCCPVFLGSLLRHLEIPFTSQRLTGHKETTGSFPFILVILPFWFSLFHWKRGACFCQQLFTSLIHTDLRKT